MIFKCRCQVVALFQMLGAETFIHHCTMLSTARAIQSRTIKTAAKIWNCHQAEIATGRIISHNSDYTQSIATLQGVLLFRMQNNQSC